MRVTFSTIYKGKGVADPFAMEHQVKARAMQYILVGILGCPCVVRIRHMEASYKLFISCNIPVSDILHLPMKQSK